MEMPTDAETVVAGRALTNLKQFFGLKSVFSLSLAAGSYQSANAQCYLGWDKARHQSRNIFYLI